MGFQRSYPRIFGNRKEAKEKVSDEIKDQIQVNEVARQICKGKDWSYTFVSEEEEYIL